MKAGFVPALGTPLDKNGKFLKESYQKQIDDQIKAGAVESYVWVLWDNRHIYLNHCVRR